jgi:hypothetical protein
MADNGSGVGTGMIAGILLVVVIIAGILFATGGLDFGSRKDVDVNVELPKAPDLPEAPAPGRE